MNYIVHTRNNIDIIILNNIITPSNAMMTLGEQQII